MIYGLPYKGSKSAIAPAIVAFLPGGRRFCDLFMGGGAVTHAAMLSGKWGQFRGSDVIPTPKLFHDAAAGEYRGEKRWISRDEFKRLYPSDLFVALAWSYGSNGHQYYLGADIEDYIRALHFAVIFGDWREMEASFGVHPTEAQKRRVAAMPEGAACSAIQNMLDWRHLAPLLSKSTQRTLTLQHRLRLARVNALQSLSRFLPSFEAVRAPYSAYERQDGDVAYCDPPYAGTDGYGALFDHAAFYDWLRSRPFPVWVSEYWMPDDFVPVFAIRKRVLLDYSNTKTRVEKVFVHRRFASATAMPIRV